MQICHIYGAGEYSDSDPPPYYPDGITDVEDFVIAADGGYDYCAEHGIDPDVIIGDFDSAKEIPFGDNVTALPREKDITDMGAGVRMGLKLGYSRLHLYGGTGGRIDHTVANIQLLQQISKYGGQPSIGYLFSGSGFGENVQVVTAVSSAGVYLPADYRGYISVFALGGEARGVTVRGLKYPLENEILSPVNPKGVSNEFIGQKSFICAASGTIGIVFDYQVVISRTE